MSIIEDGAYRGNGRHEHKPYAVPIGNGRVI